MLPIPNKEPTHPSNNLQSDNLEPSQLISSSGSDIGLGHVERLPSRTHQWGVPSSPLGTLSPFMKLPWLERVRRDGLAIRLSLVKTLAAKPDHLDLIP